MDTFYAKLSKSSSKPIALSLIPEYADSYILKSRCVPTISDLFDKRYLALSYPELLKACQEVDIEITKEQMLQVDKRRVTVSSDIELEESGPPRVRLLVRQIQPCPPSHLFSLSAILN